MQIKAIAEESGEATIDRIERFARHVPLVRNSKIRLALGLALLVLSLFGAQAHAGVPADGYAVMICLAGWGISVFLTDKYVHKYPQRYYPYLMAAHTKAAFTMAGILASGEMLIGNILSWNSLLWTTFIGFCCIDFLASVLRRRDKPNVLETGSLPRTAERGTNSSSSAPAPGVALNHASIDTRKIIEVLNSSHDSVLTEFVTKNLPMESGTLRQVDSIGDLEPHTASQPTKEAALLVATLRINDVRRLNKFLSHCTSRIALGGFFVVRYTPLEYVAADLRARHSGAGYYSFAAFHFLWYRALPKLPWLDSLYFSRRFSWLDERLLSSRKRNRALSKAEMWGRLSYWGMEVIAESQNNGERYLIARRTSAPVHNKRPSYYPVVALEKVALDGGVIRMHKFRTMYPFSEFLQKRIFQDHGLTASGKFKDDFRLTELGKFLRRYWLDELPQIFDWLRGDVKLVGIRATSRHFLSLYPREFYDLYVQIKPGLVPPLFSESTGGLEKIVEIEMTYLQRYIKAPLRTDVSYLLQTLADIFLRGIRSK